MSKYKRRSVNWEVETDVDIDLEEFFDALNEEEILEQCQRLSIAADLRPKGQEDDIDALRRAIRRRDWAAATAAFEWLFDASPPDPIEQKKAYEATPKLRDMSS